MGFPDPCGAALAMAVQNGADPATVVPDDFYVVHGGETPIANGMQVSCTVGPTLEAAAAAVPHGQIRWSVAGTIRALGGTVHWLPQRSRKLTLNQQHVDVLVPTGAPFSELQKNPVPRSQRIDGKP